MVEAVRERHGADTVAGMLIEMWVAILAEQGAVQQYLPQE